MRKSVDASPFAFLHKTEKESFNERVLNFILDHIRLTTLYFVFFLTFGTLMFFSVIWIISILIGIAISMAIDLTIDWVYVDECL